MKFNSFFNTDVSTYTYYWKSYIIDNFSLAEKLIRKSFVTYTISKKKMINSISYYIIFDNIEEFVAEYIFDKKWLRIKQFKCGVDVEKISSKYIC
ncbi:MAG: hypothetical protein ACOC1K_02845 [Nanoarchaeota archaeon]